MVFAMVLETAKFEDRGIFAMVWKQRNSRTMVYLRWFGSSEFWDHGVCEGFGNSEFGDRGIREGFGTREFGDRAICEVVAR